jgi:hypothetical protein
MNRGFKKSATGKTLGISGVSSGDLNSKVNMTFGTIDLAQKRAREKVSHQSPALRRNVSLIYVYPSTQGIRIEEIVIHPDYWSDKTKHGNSFDLALVKTDRDIYDGKGIMENGAMLIHPICLPPFGPVDWEWTRWVSALHCTTLHCPAMHCTALHRNWTVVEKHRLYTNGTGQYGWLRLERKGRHYTPLHSTPLRPDKPRIPFEDMDCKLTFKVSSRPSKP